jgi:MacB-like periplasmic core domain
VSWLRQLISRPKLYGELSEEIREHLDEKVEALIADGMSREDAAAAARREFGNVTLIELDSRKVWQWPPVENLFRDIRFSLRMLIKNPGSTAVAVAALALGIGADTAMYTIVNGSLSWDMGLDNRDQIVVVIETDALHSQEWDVSYPDFRDFRSQTKSLAGLAAYQFAPVNLSDRSGLPERYYCVQMSANGFSVVGQKPLLGRDFIAEDERPGAPAVMIIAYHVWRDRYAQDPAIIGKTVRVEEIPRVVIGVMPPGKQFPEDTDLWTPLITNAVREKRDNRNLFLFGRLSAGVSPALARTRRTPCEAVSRHQQGHHR